MSREKLEQNLGGCGLLGVDIPSLGIQQHVFSVAAGSVDLEYITSDYESRMENAMIPDANGYICERNSNSRHVNLRTQLY